MPEMLLFTHTAYIGSHIVLYMNLLLELENCYSVAQLVIELERHRRVAGLIPTNVPIVAFFCFL